MRWVRYFSNAFIAASEGGYRFLLDTTHWCLRSGLLLYSSIESTFCATWSILSVSALYPHLTYMSPHSQDQMTSHDLILWVRIRKIRWTSYDLILRSSRGIRGILTIHVLKYDSISSFEMHLGTKFSLQFPSGVTTSWMYAHRLVNIKQILSITTPISLLNGLVTDFASVVKSRGPNKA